MATIAKSDSAHRYAACRGGVFLFLTVVLHTDNRTNTVVPQLPDSTPAGEDDCRLTWPWASGPYLMESWPNKHPGLF